jgi:3-oxoacyl-[acyl-carrier-protein] synthase II
MELKRVVVTGLGAVTPLGNDVAGTWQALLHGVSGAGPITRFNAEKFKTRFACEVKGFDPAVYFTDRKEIRKCDLYAQYAIASSDEAIKDSQLNLETENKDRIGVIFSSGIGGISTFQEEIMGYDE